MKPSLLILLVIAALVFGLSLAIPAEDDPDTSYDESELLPYEVISPLLITVMRQTAASQALVKTDLVARLRYIATRNETRAEQSEPPQQHSSKSIVVLNCLRRC